MPGLNFSPNWSLLIKNHKRLLEIWYNSADGWRERSRQGEGLFLPFSSLGRMWLQGPHIAFGIGKEKYPIQNVCMQTCPRWTEYSFEWLDFSSHKMENDIGKRQSYRLILYCPDLIKPFL